MNVTEIDTAQGYPYNPQKQMAGVSLRTNQFGDIKEDSNEQTFQQTDINGEDQMGDILPSTPQQIQGDGDQLSNSIDNADDSLRTSSKKSQIQTSLLDNPTSQIPTSTQQNEQQKEKEIQKMATKNKSGDDWIKQSLQSLQKRNIYQNVGPNIQDGRPNLQVIDQTFTDADDIPIQNDQYTSNIQQPKAIDQGINDFLSANQDDPTSEVDIQRVNKASKADMARREVDRDQLLQMLEDLQTEDDMVPSQSPAQSPAQSLEREEGAVQQPQGKNLITQVPQQRVVQFIKSSPNPDDNAVHQWAAQNNYDKHSVQNQIYKLATKRVTGQRQVTPQQPVNQSRGLKKKNAILINQNNRLKTLANFIIKNFSSLNENRIKQAVKIMNKRGDVNQLKQRYRQCQVGIISQASKTSEKQKKIFESNAGKFNKLRQNILNNKAEARDVSPQIDRLRELAGLNDD